MSRQKEKGTKGETAIIKFFHDNGLEAKRLALSGAKDQGDIELISVPLVLEVKSGQQTANPNRAKIEEWLNETRAEAANSDKPCVLVVNRYRHRPKDCHVYIPKDGYSICMFLDEFIKELKRHGNGAI